MKLDISIQEQSLILEGLAKHEASCKRAVNTVKDQTIKDCYAKQEADCKVLTHKILTNKTI